MKSFVLLLATLLLCSCTAVNSGSYLDSIGRECPEVQSRQNKNASSTWLAWETVYETWRLGDYYYVKLPVVYIPRNEPLLICFTTMPWMGKEQWVFPSGPEAGRLDRHAYLTTLPCDIYYAELTEEQLLSCSPVHISQSADKQTFRLLRASEIDLSKATKVQNSFIFNPDSLIPDT